MRVLPKLRVIIGSTRKTRSADLVLPWAKRRTREKGSFDVEALDLRDWPLPIFAENAGTTGGRNDPIYSDPVVKTRNAKTKVMMLT